MSAAAVLLAAVLAPAACSAVAATQAVAPASAAPPVPVLHWRSCYGGFQCATARVPLSYRDPRGAAISIAVLAEQSYVDGGRKLVTYAAVHSSATGGTLARVTLPGLLSQGAPRRSGRWRHR